MTLYFNYTAFMMEVTISSLGQPTTTLKGVTQYTLYEFWNMFFLCQSRSQVFSVKHHISFSYTFVFPHVSMHFTKYSILTILNKDS